eukprot:scaffold39964_cov68-Phaeocystis_antarctica.AAC.2
MCALHATVLSSSGPARKYTAKFEPAAWSRAQTTSGFGATKRIRAQNAPGAHRARPRGCIGIAKYKVKQRTKQAHSHDSKGLRQPNRPTRRT